MLPAAPVALLTLRLDPHGRPWRLRREADLRLRLVNVPIAYHPDQPGLPYACTALPGRYLAALWAQSQQEAWPGPRLILSPGYDIDVPTLRAVVATLEDIGFGAATDRHDRVLLLHDHEDRLLAYAIPGALHLDANQLNELRFLSATQAGVDADLLGALGLAADVLRLRLPPDWPLPPGLPQFPYMRSVPVATAQARLRMWRSGRRQTLAVMTHHAGDVLLAVRALNLGRHTVDGLVVHRAYADVARAGNLRIPLIEIDGPLFGRQSLASPMHPMNDEVLYFERVVRPALPADASFILLRPSRGYHEAAYSLAAQFAVTLGEFADAHLHPPGAQWQFAPESRPAEQHTDTEDSPPPACADLPRQRLPHIRGRRVLLHFDGGWPLKLYPPDWQRTLVRELTAQGFQPTILGPALEGARGYPFRSLAEMDALMREHDVLVGMDSFPCHYASQVVGLPTLCLYASTSMANLAHEAPDYLAVCQGLTCSPCGAWATCPRYGDTRCHNFAPPETVIELVTQCLQAP